MIIEGIKEDYNQMWEAYIEEVKKKMHLVNIWVKVNLEEHLQKLELSL